MVRVYNPKAGGHLVALVAVLVVATAAFVYLYSTGLTGQSRASAGGILPACQSIVTQKNICHQDCISRLATSSDKAAKAECHNRCNTEAWNAFMTCLRANPPVLPTGGVKPSGWQQPTGKVKPSINFPD